MKTICNITGTIGRIYTLHAASSGDAYYLRMLLHQHHCIGAKSPEDLCTFDGEVLSTYRAVCIKLGLLEHDQQWHAALQEAAHVSMPPQMRTLFLVIVTTNEPSGPAELFEEFSESMGEDYVYRWRRRVSNQLTHTDVRLMVLYELERRLHDHQVDVGEHNAPSVLAHFNLPELTESERERAQSLHGELNRHHLPAVYRHELSFDRQKTQVCTCDVRSHACGNLCRVCPDNSKQALHDDHEPKLKLEQRRVYTNVTTAVAEGKGGCHFIDAIAGSGKTYTLNTMAAAVRLMDFSDGKVCV